MTVDMDKKNSDSGQDTDAELRARSVKMQGLFPKAQRAPTGLFKSLINLQPFERINSMSILSSPLMAEQEGAISFMCDADLWRSFAAAYGKCDCMVEGKYKKARVFAFETENLHIWCESETGDRGTGWFVSEKSAPAQNRRGRSYQFARWDEKSSSKRSEVQAFIKDLIVGAALADEATMEEYAPSVAWVREAKGARAAMVEADAMGAAALPAVARARKAGL